MLSSQTNNPTTVDLLEGSARVFIHWVSESKPLSRVSGPSSPVTLPLIQPPVYYSVPRKRLWAVIWTIFWHKQPFEEAMWREVNSS